MFFVNVATKPNNIEILGTKWAKKLRLRFLIAINLFVPVQI